MILNVNTKEPKNNLFLNIFHFDDIEKDGGMYSGFNILLPSIEIEDFQSKLYHTNLISENKIALKNNIADLDPYTIAKLVCIELHRIDI